MRLIPIRHADLKGIQSTLQPIFSKTGALLVYEPMNMLIVIDVESNVSRIIELINMLDTSAPKGAEQIVTLQQIVHNDVTEIHKTVSELFSNLVRKGKPIKFKLLIESRLNSLFIVANRETTDDIIELIEQVDVPVEGAKTTIHELQYSDAAKLVPLITTVFPKTASIKIVPFAPFNALIIIANPTTSQQIIDLVDQLDIPRGNREIKLHQLQYAAATTLAPLLSRIFADKVVAGKGEGKAGGPAPRSKRRRTESDETDFYEDKIHDLTGTTQEANTSPADITYGFSSYDVPTWGIMRTITQSSHWTSGGSNFDFQLDQQIHETNHTKN